MDNNESKRVIEIPTHGTQVWKYQLRAIIGVSFQGWKEEITLIKRKNQSFGEQYAPFNNYKRIPTSLARVIIEHVFASMGEEIEIRFVVGSKDI